MAGCTSPTDSGSPPAFDGDGAYEYVAGLVTEANGDPRYRIPGTEGQETGAQWLWDQLNATGWTRGWQNFTGADFIKRQGDSLAPYTRPGACPQEDEDAVRELPFKNLWARYDAPASQLGDQTLLLGAHWDSKEDAEEGGPMLGANDGASGVGVILQLMQHISSGALVPTVDIAIGFFDGEDGFEDCHPLAGSTLFAQEQPAGPIQRMILLDMVGDLDARFIRETRSLQSDPSLVDLLWKNGRAHGGADQFTFQEKGVMDDHVPFIEANIRAVDIIDFGRSTGGKFGFPPYWHTAGDTLENIDPEMLEIVGNTLWVTLESPELERTW